ncbi:MAG: hypothetical protein HPY66_0434 [Firmicutes bacterium]|nr:hypothetical protein [Bacillota bacterium]
MGTFHGKECQMGTFLPPVSDFGEEVCPLALYAAVCPLTLKEEC